MDTTRLSTKGQVVIPRGIRKSRAWAPGTELTVEETAEGILLRPAGHFPATDLSDVTGCMPTGGKAKSPSRMKAAVASEVVRRHDRGRY